MELMKTEKVFADRGPAFRMFVRDMLRRGNVKDKYLDILTSDKHMVLYFQAFTHSSVDEANNYESWEILGDVTCNKNIVWYLTRRIPALVRPEGVRFTAMYKTRYSSKVTFSNFAESAGFLPFISAREGFIQQRPKPLLEDTFEAFFGVTEYILNAVTQIGVGDAVCYNILATFMDRERIDLSYDSVLPVITQVKQIFDNEGNREILGIPRGTDGKAYGVPVCDTLADGQSRCFYRIPQVSGNFLEFGHAVAPSQKAAKDVSANLAMGYLRARFPKLYIAVIDNSFLVDAVGGQFSEPVVH